MGSQNIVYGVNVQILMVKYQHLKMLYDFNVSSFMNWSLKAGKICCLRRFWVVAGHVRQVVHETRIILMENTLGGN